MRGLLGDVVEALLHQQRHVLAPLRERRQLDADGAELLGQFARVAGLGLRVVGTQVGGSDDPRRALRERTGQRGPQCCGQVVEVAQVQRAAGRALYLDAFGAQSTRLRPA